MALERQHCLIIMLSGVECDVTTALTRYHGTCPLHVHISTNVMTPAGYKIASLSLYSYTDTLSCLMGRPNNHDRAFVFNQLEQKIGYEWPIKGLKKLKTSAPLSSWTEHNPIYLILKQQYKSWSTCR